jgi:hypothetical protein
MWDASATLMSIFGPVIVLLLGLVGYFVKRTLNTIDSINKILPGLVTKEDCRDRIATCQERFKVKQNGDAKADVIEEKLFLEKWENLLERVRRIENHLPVLPRREAGL